MHRKPSHFGSYRTSPAGGSCVAALASIGATGGRTGRSMSGPRRVDGRAVVEHQPPAAVVPPGEQVDGGDRGAALITQQVLVDRHPAGVAVDGGRDLGEKELQRLTIAEQRDERRDNGGPTTERRPSGVGAHAPVRVLPEIAHGVDVPSFEGIVEGLVGSNEVLVVDARNVALDSPPMTQPTWVTSGDGAQIAAYD